MDQTQPPHVPADRRDTTRRQAQQLRANWLHGVAAGDITPVQLLKFAALDEGRWLRPISLTQLLMARPGKGRGSAESLLNQLRTELRYDGDARLTIGWLLDARTRGSRYAAWLRVTEVGRRLPWPNWPFAPSPW